MATDDLLSDDRPVQAEATSLAEIETAAATSVRAEDFAETQSHGPVGASGESPESTESEEPEAVAPPGRRFQLNDTFKGFGACGFSIVFHVFLLVVLGLLVVDDSIRVELQTLFVPFEEPPEEQPVAIELNEQIEAVTEQTLDVLTSAPAIGAAGPAAVFGTPVLDQRAVEQAEATEVVIDAPTLGIPDSVGLIESVPDGEVKGEPRDIVGDYKQAMDRLTQELIWMLDAGPVTIIWLFDQSMSMKDDQKEIRDRVDVVYDQLGIVGTSNSDALLTSVVSYGLGFQEHTAKPTSNRELIRRAIDSVPVDASGKEMMCQALGLAVSKHRRAATRRQLALILVTDESGEPANNDRYLEAAIREAKSARCKIYVLGREAVFGYPYAHIRWRHPQTDRMHWLQIDRGPETGFPEQLQTDGFRRRSDAFSSGFGPYEEARLARETNGIFFMLPTVEKDLVGAGNKHRYELESLRPFVPDLRSRIEVFAERDKYPLRQLIWKVISDLNPYNPVAKDVVELKTDGFSLQRPVLFTQIRENQQKAKLLLQYMGMAEKTLESGRQLREQEADPRWQANYDLIYAQLVAYQARIYEYGVGLEVFLANWQTEVERTPRTRGKEMLIHWDARTRPETITQESRPYQLRATELLSFVQEQFPGTPWSARARYELKRGYGVYCFPDYDLPYKTVKNPIKVPNL